MFHDVLLSGMNFLGLKICFWEKIMLGNRITIRQILKGLLSVLVLVSFNAIAEEGVVSISNQDASSDDILNAFMGEQKTMTNTPTSGMKFRGISLGKKKEVATQTQESEMSQQFAANQAADACMAGARSVAINIRFQSNSSTIESQDSQMLKKIAQAMNTPQLQHCFFVIEGHTDAIGETYYNLWLSQQRADSVKKHLSQYNVTSKRMIVVGKGEDELLNPDEPDSSENRRVQFRVINSSR